MKLGAIITSYLLIQPFVYADLTINPLPIKSLEAANQSFSKTGASSFEDDLTPDQTLKSTPLTEEQRHEAAVWQLTSNEETRYIFLMQNRSKLYYQGLNLTPLDILGLNARSDAERDHFAALAARQEAQKVAQNIAWNNAFYKAYNALFKNIPVVGTFDPTPYAPMQYQPIELKTNDSLYWFIKPEYAIQTVLLPLIEAIERTPQSTLHLMLVGTDDMGIQEWANRHQIPLSLVSSNRITLNHGELAYQSLKLDKKSLPLLLLSREGQSHVVDLGNF